MNIAVDVMGTDYGPEEIILGALQAAESYDCTIYLVGDSLQIDKVIGEHAKDIRHKIHITHATEVIAMDEHPASAIRKKKDSSIVVATRLVKDGYCDAVISAGSTGAAVTAALFGLGRIHGVDRPTIATPIPSEKGTTIVLDSGANVDCKPIHLVQSAIMGSMYAEHFFGLLRPRVGLLNIGEESTKGNEQALDTYPLLKEISSINFVGNVEGNDITNGSVDVVVCDGFVGNVILKFGEGISKTILSLLKKAIEDGGFLSMLGAYLIKPAFKSLKRKLDPAEYGGALLLGVDGEFIICHGSSKAKAIKNAIGSAIEFKNRGVLNHIRLAIQKEREAKR